jgi:Cu-Zn family superoxide dismutase
MALLVAIGAGGLGLVVQERDPVALAQSTPVGATAEIRGASNRLLATAEFREGRGEVLVNLQFPNPPVLSGGHAIHINEVGRCDGPGYSTSGQIFNPFNKQHGRSNPDGSEVGDLPNVNVSTGLTSYNTNAIGATLGQGPGSLLSPNRSIVIYAGEDDQQTSPDGNPGVPIGCGVIAGVAAAQIPILRASPGVVSSPPPVAAQPSAVRSVVVQSVTQVARVSASPAVAVAPLPTPISAPVIAAQPTSSSSSGTLNGLIIAVLGVGLVGVGVMLRQRRQLH